MALPPVACARLQATVACAGSAVVWWRVGGPIAGTCLSLTGAIAFLACLAPVRYAPVQRALDTFAHGVATGFTWLVLGLVDFGLFTPLSILRALLRRAPLQLRPAPAAVSFLQPLSPRRPGGFQRPF